MLQKGGFCSIEHVGIIWDINSKIHYTNCLYRFLGNPIEEQRKFSNGRRKLHIWNCHSWCQLCQSRQSRYPHSKYREYVDERETKTTSTIWNVQSTVSDIPFRISMEELLPEWWQILCTFVLHRWLICCITWYYYIIVCPSTD